ncbi:MAG: catalase [Saprospiraceae bacterium]|nr:catalase [Saprospiraceae bacterium]
MSTNTNWQQDIHYLGGSAEKEEALIRKFAKDIREAVHASTQKRKAPPIRPQHAKQLVGIKRVEFRVSLDISADLQYGFLQPGLVFPAHVRFSNAAGEIRLSDAEGDLRGAAIRVLPDTGPAHDWLMTNAEQHHAKDAIGAMATSLAFARGSWGTSFLEALLARQQHSQTRYSGSVALPTG